MIHGRPERARASGEVRAWLVAGLGLGCFVGGAWLVHARRPQVAHAAAITEVTAHAEAAPAGGPVELQVLYSTEMAAWLRASVSDFERAHPDVRVRLQGMGTVDAVRAIADGRVRPTLWIPADTLAADLLDREWRAAHGDAIVTRDDAWPRPLALTPMVFVVWESRARALVGDSTTLSWTRLGAVARASRGWAEVGGSPAWGALRFGHTDPARSHAGLQTLVLMAHGWRDAPRLDAAALSGAGFTSYLRTLEASDPAGDRGTASSGEFAQTIALQGPGRYDAAMVYESQAIASFEVARGRWGETLRVYYPTVNVWADHPLCLLDGGHLTDAQKDAARALSEHLLGAGTQAAAVRHGFRPADANVPLVNGDADNPFVKYRDQGVRVALAQVAPPPSLAAVDAVMAAWRRATGR